jgi:hypothetical protein
MQQIEISINPFAEYLEATELRRISILKEQMVPDKIRLPYYQLAKARIKSSIIHNADYAIINDSISILKERKPQKNGRWLTKRIQCWLLNILKI